MIDKTYPLTEFTEVPWENKSTFQQLFNEILKHNVSSQFFPKCIFLLLSELMWSYFPTEKKMTCSAIFLFINIVICSPRLTRKKGVNSSKKTVNYSKEKSSALRNNKRTGLSSCLVDHLFNYNPTKREDRMWH